MKRKPTMEPLSFTVHIDGTPGFYQLPTRVPARPGRPFRIPQDMHFSGVEMHWNTTDELSDYLRDAEKTVRAHRDCRERDAAYLHIIESMRLLKAGDFDSARARARTLLKDLHDLETEKNIKAGEGPIKGGDKRGKQQKSEGKKNHTAIKLRVLELHKQCPSMPYKEIRAQVHLENQLPTGRELEASAKTIDRATEDIHDRDSWGK
jgi:hypothetical protein